MTMQPLLDAPIPMPMHPAAMAAAFVVGTWLIYFSHKGAPGRLLVRATIVALTVAARGASRAVSLAKDALLRRRFAVRGPLLGGLVASAAINMLVLHAVAHDVVLPAPPASMHAELFPLVTIDLGADR
jgi:hypothetical protein